MRTTATPTVIRISSGYYDYYPGYYPGYYGYGPSLGLGFYYGGHGYHRGDRGGHSNRGDGGVTAATIRAGGIEATQAGMTLGTASVWHLECRHRSHSQALQDSAGYAGGSA